MSRPLLITDCDEVLLHMVVPFGAWLEEAHAIDFRLEGHEFGSALRRRSDGAVIAREEVWPLLDGFFISEMDRQTLVPHAREALERLAQIADVVVLTNLADHHQAGRMAQLDAHGIRFRVVTNQGGKGTPVARLIEDFAPSVAVFVDDLPQHHESVARRAPQVHRLHMVSEPTLAPKVAPAPFAHARIDDWRDAERWIAARFAAGLPAGA